MATYLPSPPPSPSITLSISTSLLSPFRAQPVPRSPSSSARAARLDKTPYPRPHNRLSKMSQTPYATWPTGVKPEPEQYLNNAQSSIASSRRSGAADQQAAFGYAGGFPQVRSSGHCSYAYAHLNSRPTRSAACSPARGCALIQVRRRACLARWATPRSVSSPARP